MEIVNHFRKKIGKNSAQKFEIKIVQSVQNAKIAPGQSSAGRQKTLRLIEEF